MSDKLVEARLLLEQSYDVEAELKVFALRNAVTAILEYLEEAEDVE